MWELMLKGGLVMWLIEGLGGIAIVLFLERLFHLHRAQIRSADFLEGIFNVLRRRNIVEAVSICEETPGPVAHIARAGILQGDRGTEEIRQAIEGAGLSEIPRLERNMGVLATIAKITPLLGLLGTVLGMMQALLVIHQRAPLVQSGDLAEGLWMALITTAAGLAVSIPTYAAYNFLVTRIESILLDMEKSSMAVLTYLSQPAVPVEVEGP